MPTPIFVVRKANDYMKVSSGCIIWTCQEHANIYSSRYAAKRHVKALGVVYDAIEPKAINENEAVGV